MKKQIMMKKVVKKTVKKIIVEAVLNESRLTPLRDRIVIRPHTEAEMGTTSASVIIIPETVSKERPERGKVIAVGNGRYEDGKLVPVRIKVGETVVFSKYGFDEVKVDGVEYLIVKEESVLAIIK